MMTRSLPAFRLARTAQAIVLLLLLLSISASARRRDPLTDAETDQLREVAMEPLKRLQLYIKFADLRLTAIDTARADAKQAQGRGQRIHDLLEDFTAILDEINDNLDQYQGHPLDKDMKKDFRKGLKEVLEAGARWDTKVAALKSAIASDPQTKRESADFRFVLQDTEDALKSTIDMAREYAEAKDKEPEPAKKK
jgi:hypothetical protein